MKKQHHRLAAGFPPPTSITGAMFIAARIIRKYQHRLPTAKELQDGYGVSRATAYRWLAALREAA